MDFWFWGFSHPLDFYPPNFTDAPELDLRARYAQLLEEMDRLRAENDKILAKAWVWLRWTIVSIGFKHLFSRKTSEANTANTGP